MAIFFSAATAAGAFGGLLARGILEMRGVGGLAGWRWLFILEGMLTFLIGSSPKAHHNVLVENCFEGWTNLDM